MSVGGIALGQSGISLYHLNNNTLQGSHFNPAFMPNGKFTMNIAGVGLDVNSRYSYNESIIPYQNAPDSVNYDGIVNASKAKNYIGAEADISTLYLGLRTSGTTGFSLFVRERASVRVFLPGDVLTFGIKGNKSFVGKELDLGAMAVDARYYREYGFGIWKSIPNKGINIGIRFKYLNGMASVISDPKFDASVIVGEEGINFDLNQATVNTSGMSYFPDSDSSSKYLPSHLISNTNRGFGIDLGAHWKINEYLSGALAVNDLGFINWKADTKNYVLNDTKFNFEGIQDFLTIFNTGICYRTDYSKDLCSVDCVVLG